MKGIDLDANIHPILTDPEGRVFDIDVHITDPVLKYQKMTETVPTAYQIWIPTAGTKFVISDILLSVSANGNLLLTDGSGGDTIMIIFLRANTSVHLNFHTPIESSAADNVLVGVISAATQGITVIGWEET